MIKKLDHMLVGVAAGLLGGVIGLFLYHLIVAAFHKTDIIYSLINYPGQRAPIISISICFNLLVFFLFIWTKRFHAARGVVLSMFAYGLAIVYFKFIA